MSRTPARAEARRRARAGARPAAREVAFDWRRLLPFGLVVAGIVAYVGSFAGVFVFDDLNAIVDNRTIRELSWETLVPPRSATRARPVVSLSLALNYALGGLDPFGYHLFNLAVHLAAALLLFAVVRRTLGLPVLRGRYGASATPIAAAVALLWVVHPLLSETVVYVIQRTELLMGLFLLAALYGLVRAAESEQPWGWQAAVVAAFALGMGSKENMVAAPLVLLAYDRLFLSPSIRDLVRRRGVMYAAIAFAGVVILVLAAGTRIRSSLPALLAGNARISSWDYAKTQCAVVVHYLRLAFWPAPLVADYEDWPVARAVTDALPQIALIALLLGATLWATLRRRPAVFLGIAFFAILAPTSSVWPLAGEIAAERRMYLPLAAVVAAVVFAAEALLRHATTDARLRRRVGALAVLATAATLAVVTIRRLDVYRDPLAFWSAIVDARPGNVRARINLGDILFKNRRSAEAMEQYAAAVRLAPGRAPAHYGYGVTLAAAGRRDEAAEQYREAIRAKPTYAQAHVNLGVLLQGRGETAEAIEHYRAAVAGDPAYANGFYNLGIALLDRGELDEAAAHLETALRLQPDFRE
ncbi:MAG TPA: tetratricopeptide repeat protein, partial [Candidatus Binatia bacterium]|nr:tetratricopeptide repeat protein [Candidatus Binatia bacterium]